MKKAKGFTLIELLVVIAIIGILSSVVLASLNSARGKGEIARTKAQLSQVRVEAELYYDGDGAGDCTGVCADMGQTTTTGLFADLGTSACVEGTNGVSYAASASAGDAFWCVDSEGASREISANTTAALCPAT